jgi:RNA polymerase sigma-70 factor (ECF subfamily)
VHDITVNEFEHVTALAEAEHAFQMTEEAFRVFYNQTSRAVWMYLARMTGDSRLADDLLQETYYRFLRSTTTFANDDHRRHYLFRIATNLARDQHRRPQLRGTASEAQPDEQRTSDHGARVVDNIDLARAMEQLRPRDRTLLWLAYAQGFSHEEIAQTLGVKAASLKALLFRARRRLASLMRGASRRTPPATGGQS